MVWRTDVEEQQRIQRAEWRAELVRLEQQEPEAPRDHSGTLVAAKPTLPTVKAFAVKPGPVSWLFTGLLPTEACMLIHAAPKTGKTWFAFYLALCLAAGHTAFGRFQTETGTVLILSPEGGINATRRRLWSLAEHMDLDVAAVQDNIHIVEQRLVRLDDPKDYECLLNTVEVLQPALVILDPIIEFHGADENAASDVSRLLAQVRGLQSVKPNLCCIVTHHNTKGSNQARGSGVFDSWYDVKVSLEKRGDSWNDPIIAHFNCRDGEPPRGISYRLTKRPIDEWREETYEPVGLEIVDEAEERRSEMEDAIIACLAEEEPFSLTRTNVRDRLELGRHEDRSRAIERMIAEGRIRKEGTKLALAGPGQTTPDQEASGEAARRSS